MKKFPSFDSLKAKEPARRQTVEQQLAIAKLWAARGRGRIGKAN